MRDRSKFEVALLGVLPGLLACSSSPLEAPGPHITLEEFTTRLGALLCGHLADCCAEIQLFPVTSGCEAQVAEDVQETLSGLSVYYDAQLAAGCLNAISERTQNCRYFGDELTLPPCDRMLRGELEPGASCTSDRECRSVGALGSYCATDFGESGGTCSARIPDGETCLRGGCAEGSFCDIFSITCTPLGTSGECQQINACASDFVCSPELECVPKLAEGANCALDLQCADGACDLDSRCARSLASQVFCAPN